MTDFPTEQGVTAAGAATKGRAHMLRAYVDGRWNHLRDVAGGTVRLPQGPPPHDYHKAGWAAPTVAHDCAARS